LDALADPAAGVRTAALRYITVYKIKEALQPIAESIRSRSFSERSFDERRGWFIALGHLAGAGGLPALLKQAEPFRGGSKIAEAAHLALLGIKATRSREGKAWMETFANETSGDLQLLTHKILAGRKGGKA
jgi:HEAT repeat protein